MDMLRGGGGGGGDRHHPLPRLDTRQQPTTKLPRATSSSGGPSTSTKGSKGGRKSSQGRRKSGQGGKRKRSTSPSGQGGGGSATQTVPSTRDHKRSSTGSERQHTGGDVQASPKRARLNYVASPSSTGRSSALFAGGRGGGDTVRVDGSLTQLHGLSLTATTTSSSVADPSAALAALASAGRSPTSLAAVREAC